MRSSEKLAELVQTVPPEIAQSITDLLVAVQRSLGEPEAAKPTPATGEVESVIREYQEKFQTLDWGLDPDAEYAADLIEVYQSTHPWTPVEK